MGKSVWKDLFREIKRTFGRFIAIFAIVAIGVAFFAGVTASSNDMKNSTDNYYDDYNMSDLRLLSSIGFNEDDIKAIRAVDGVKGVYPAYSQDAVIVKDSIETAVHIMSVPIIQTGIMRITLTSYESRKDGFPKIAVNVL